MRDYATSSAARARMFTIRSFSDGEHIHTYSGIETLRLNLLVPYIRLSMNPKRRGALDMGRKLGMGGVLLPLFPRSKSIHSHPLWYWHVFGSIHVKDVGRSGDNESITASRTLLIVQAASSSLFASRSGRSGGRKCGGGAGCSINWFGD